MRVSRASEDKADVFKRPASKILEGARAIRDEGFNSKKRIVKKPFTKK